MGDLRWTLLLLGAVFVAGLAWWELRRPRQARRGELGSSSEREAAPEPLPPGAAQREPTLTLPEMRARDPLPVLPMVEVVDDLSIALRADTADDDIDLLAGEAAEPSAPPPDPLLDPQDPSRLERHDAPLALPPEPSVDWPEESVRHVVALRLVASGERFAGHAVRQALAAEGFVLGRLSIFHRAGPDGRAVVSAANLTQPGTFDSESIDMQRFGGLSLFAVLPGPLSSVRAFDELLSSARNLSNRLLGLLQDERGEALTPLRVAEMREELEAQAEHES
ncbi:MAG: cell division protein ZipA C-terminal FtsZ-binding domain-containing protein [Steroidobacteraceae bacterium]